MPTLIRVSLDTSDQKNQTDYFISKETVIIGREPSCHIQIEDERVSRHHAMIVYQNGEYLLVDNGSSNGVLLNGQWVSKQCALKNYDTICLGGHAFLFQNTEGQVPEDMLATAKLIRRQTLGKDAPVRKSPEKVVVRHQPKPQQALPKTVVRKKMVIEGVGTDFDWSNFAIWGVIVVVGLLLVFGVVRVWPKHGKVKAGAGALSKEVVAAVPQVSNGLALLQGSMAWLPPTHAIEAVASGDLGSVQLSNVNKFTKSILSRLNETWKAGLMLYEPMPMAISLGAGDRAKFVWETALSNPTFWDYNSTVVPEKRGVVGPFVIPSLEDSLFFERDLNLTAKVSRFNKDEFPWHHGVLGLLWSGDPLTEEQVKSIRSLRWMVLVRASTLAKTIQINTVEGNLSRNTPAEYKFKQYPAEVVAEIVYQMQTGTIVGIRTNTRVFQSLEDERKGRALLEKGFPIILERKPSTNREIMEAFSIK